ncbi:MAG TPA: GntR family transcriptional regulator [Defluviitaleaceae bacterium]|nr:GntR family transcriptional regulator [Candidatus Epulonipiscium sp.]HOQ17020.1 GntR family transcriptional regulator [Defluviitaleaceae bacterium]HPT76056.1 GntR family transcriptional regulator [Defluviitaleaceae bacterium]HQD49914.1 GntR family transcriptional regulator [Defluviitaleaceae bacterium]
MKIILSNSSDKPIYEQIVEQIRSQILYGELSEGTQLPSIRKLAQELRISVITTKRAYEELEREKLIETVAGKGSFVASQNKELMREKKLAEIENKLSEAIKDSKLLNMTLDDLIEILRFLYEEDKHE